MDSFWSKIKKLDCWIWQAAKTEKGYGVFGINGKTHKAHRVAYELVKGKIPPGMCVLHKCDTPACCNPDHLFLGTKADNNADMLSKGRHVPGASKTHVDSCLYVSGELHHAAKLNEASVVLMREDRARGMSYSALGKKYGVNTSAAYKVCKKLLWRKI